MTIWAICNKYFKIKFCLNCGYNKWSTNKVGQVKVKDITSSDNNVSPLFYIPYIIFSTCVMNREKKVSFYWLTKLQKHFDLVRWKASYHSLFIVELLISSIPLQGVRSWETGWSTGLTSNLPASVLHAAGRACPPPHSRQQQVPQQQAAASDDVCLALPAA